MSKKRMLPIDGDRMMTQFGRKGLDPRQVSEDIGHDRGYLQDCYRLGRIGRPETMTIEKVYGIRYADYEWIENEQKELPLLAQGQPDKGSDINKDILTELYDIIKRAVKDAIREEREANE